MNIYSDSDETKSYYLRIAFLGFLKIYSSFSSENWSNENQTLLKLLSIILSIIRDKNSRDVQ